MTDEQPIMPTHVAVIMDGNGRWAKKRDLPRSEGHRAGAEAVRRLADAALAAGVRYVTLFCFSSENWNRPAAEIKALFSLFDEYLDRNADSFREKGINLAHMGRIEKLPALLQTKLKKVEAKNIPPEREKLRLILALSYGGRDEIAAAARVLAERVEAGALKPEEITAETVAGALYLPDVPDPDLLIRTSGELRISNFMLWQSAYAEFYFTETLWPDFSEADLETALAEYAGRKRRFGKV